MCPHAFRNQKIPYSYSPALCINNPGSGRVWTGSSRSGRCIAVSFGQCVPVTSCRCVAVSFGQCVPVASCRCVAVSFGQDVAVSFAERVALSFAQCHNSYRCGGVRGGHGGGPARQHGLDLR